MIIAAGLSIQDPRERPLEQKEAATAAHKQFFDPQSAFLSLLNIWNAVHEDWDQLRTQGQRAVAAWGEPQNQDNTRIAHDKLDIFIVLI